MKIGISLKLQITSVGFALALASGGCATMAPQPVMGHNDPTVDVTAVQQAVDHGGTVLLKGEFDFGNKGNVTITRDVTVIGDADDSGKPRTTIKGGQSTLRSLRPDGAAGPGPKITIKHIHFDGASWMPIQVAFSSGTVISGNLITRVRPVEFPPAKFSGGKPYKMQHGMAIGPGGSEPGKSVPYLPDSVTGSLTITDNEIDLEGDAPKTTVGMAIFVARTTGINAEITGNRIRNVSRNGIEVIDNYRGSDGSGQVVMQDNFIETPADGAPIPSPRAPNGILAGYYLDSSAAIDPKRAIPHTIINNKVRARGQTPSSWGIAVLMDRALVKENHVTLEGKGALGITVSGSYNRIAQNRIDGSGAFGIGLGPYPPMTASNNELTNNDFAQLKTTVGDILLNKGANHNRVVGSSGSVKDSGEGNLTDGLKPVAQAPN